MRLSAASVVPVTDLLCAFLCYVRNIMSGGELLVDPHEGLLGHNSSLHAIHLAGCFSWPQTHA